MKVVADEIRKRLQIYIAARDGLKICIEKEAGGYEPKDEADIRIGLKLLDDYIEESLKFADDFECHDFDGRTIEDGKTAKVLRLRGQRLQSKLRYIGAFLKETVPGLVEKYPPLRCRQ